MKAKRPQGYAVIFYESDKKYIKPLQESELSDIQKECLMQLADDVKQRIYLGECAGVIDLENGKSICQFNMENFRMTKYQVESLARTILPDVQEYFSKEENQIAYKKWKAEREQKK